MCVCPIFTQQLRQGEFHNSLLIKKCAWLAIFSMHFSCIIVPFSRYLTQVKETVNNLNNLQRGLYIINCKIKMSPVLPTMIVI